jgi:LAGLIDADG endonuclease
VNIRYCSNKFKNNIFKGYLAGLFEGDGHIWIKKPNKKKKHNPRYCITFSMKNEPLALRLLELIGSGFIRYKLQDNACVLVVSSVVGLKKIVHLVNGEFRTPKIHQLYSIDWLNMNHNTNLIKLPLKNSSLSEDSWLSGFIDSDGSFSVQHTKIENGAKKRKISCRLRIEQRMLDPITNNSYSEVLTNITNFLDCKLLTREQKSTSNQYYTLTASSKISLNIIINYLEKYPLFSSKYMDYKDWKEIVLLIFENKHYTEEGLNKTEFVRNSMNRQRTHFTWDHLNKLYI